MTVDNTLKKRAEKYGDFKDIARITEEFQHVIENSPNSTKLSDQHKVSLYMICHKMARILCGDPLYADNAHDIAGYATLLEDHLNEGAKKPNKITNEWIPIDIAGFDGQPVDNDVLVEVEYCGAVEKQTGLAAFFNWNQNQDEEGQIIGFYRVISESNNTTKGF